MKDVKNTSLSRTDIATLEAMKDVKKNAGHTFIVTDETEPHDRNASSRIVLRRGVQATRQVGG